MTHRDIAFEVHEKFGAGDWWAQTVTVGHERIRGLRAIGQRRAGAWKAATSRATKTAARPLSLALTFDP
jgi:hypothetical protein